MKSFRGTGYIGLVILAGITVLGYNLWHWSSQDWTRFLLYCTISLIASGMKVSLPGVMGTMSMSFLFVLIGISGFSESETLTMGCLSMLAQCLFYTRTRPKPVQVSFSVAS